MYHVIFLVRYKKYLKEQESDVLQPSITGCMTAAEPYPAGHPKQQAITDAIINDLIVGCCLPMSVVENQNFRHFLSVIDKHYTPICRATVTKLLKEKAEEKESQLKTALGKAISVNLTVDIWSDRQMRGFMGVTAHFVQVT
jgi:hypothetical protein